MEDVTVADAMEGNPFTVEPDTTVKEAVDIMIDNDISSLPVVQGGEMVGLATSEDILKRTIGGGKFSEETKIGEVMTESPVTISEGDELTDAIEVMADHGIKRLLVTEGDELVGILTDGDVMRMAPGLIDDLYDELEELQEEAALSEEGDVCESCGNYATDLDIINGELICQECQASGAYM